MRLLSEIESKLERVIELLTVLVSQQGASPDLQRDPVADWKAGLPDHERLIVETAETNGLLAAFITAAKAVQPDTWNAKNPARSLISFLRIAAPQALSSGQKLALLTAFGKHDFFVMRNPNGVAAIFIDGILSWFVPLKFISGIAADTKKIKLANFSDQSKGLQDFVRGRMGYVPAGAGSIFAEHLKARSYGDFARPAL